MLWYAILEAVTLENIFSYLDIHLKTKGLVKECSVLPEAASRILGLLQLLVASRNHAHQLACNRASRFKCMLCGADALT